MLNHLSIFAIVEVFQRYIHSDKSICSTQGQINIMIEYINTHKWLDHIRLKCLLEVEGNRFTDST